MKLRFQQQIDKYIESWAITGVDEFLRDVQVAVSDREVERRLIGRLRRRRAAVHVTSGADEGIGDVH